MSFLDKFKKKPAVKKEEDVKVETKKEMKPAEPKAAKVAEKPAEKKIEKKADQPEAPKLTPRKEKAVLKHDKEDTGNAYKVLLRPLLTEKITDLGAFNKYAFSVANSTTKNEIKKAIRSLYGVEPIKVNIIKVSGKKIRSGKTSGHTSDWKKAIITLKDGETIQVYEGV